MGLGWVGQRSEAAVPASSAPSPELVAAHRVLERLAAAAQIEQPLTLVVRTGPARACPSSTTQGSTSGYARIEEATANLHAETLPAGPSLACLRTSALPSALPSGFFGPFVVALQQQSDPFASEPPAVLAVAGRTLLLHLPGPPAGRPSPPPSRAGATSAVPPSRGLETDAAACLLARELAALQLGQPEQRAKAFEDVHRGLANSLQKSAQSAHSAQSTREVGQFLLSPLLMMLSKATTPSEPNPLSRQLQASPHWLVLSRYATPVAEALGSFGDLPEEALKKAWPSFDPAFAMAAQDRLELVERHQATAQDAALLLLAEAGIDPRPCAALYRPAVDAARLASVTAAWERARTNPAVIRRTLPRRFQPEKEAVVIFPARSQPALAPR
jgi:hypothetical protein